MLHSTIMSRISGTLLTKDQFHFKQLQEIEVEIPWDNLHQLVNSYYLATSVGQHLIPTKTMNRVFFLQLRYDLRASEVEEALFKFGALRDFAFIDIDKDVIPNEIYIEDFNQLISEKNLKDAFIQLFDVEALAAD